MTTAKGYLTRQAHSVSVSFATFFAADMEAFVLTFCNSWISFGTLLFSHSSSTALQKDSFCIVKDMLL